MIIAVIAIVAAGIVIGIVLSFQKKPDKKPSMPTETDDGIYTVINADDDGGSIFINVSGIPASDVKA